MTSGGRDPDALGLALLFQEGVRASFVEIAPAAASESLPLACPP